MKKLIALLVIFLSMQSFALDINFSEVEEMLGAYVNEQDKSYYYEITWSNEQLNLSTNEILLPECADVHLGPIDKINTKFKYFLGETEYILMYVPIISSCSSWNFKPWLTILYNKDTKSLLVKRSVIKGYRKTYNRKF